MNTQFSSFNQVTVNKDDLLTAVMANKKTHDQIHADAMTGYYEKVAKELEKRLDMLDKVRLDFETSLNNINPETEKPVEFNFTHRNKLFDLSVPFPTNHTQAYERAIKMIEMSADDKFVLTQDEFRQYVMNDWDWKQAFISSNSMYLTKASSADLLKKF